MAATTAVVARVEGWARVVAEWTEMVSMGPAAANVAVGADPDFPEAGAMR